MLYVANEWGRSVYEFTEHSLPQASLKTVATTIIRGMGIENVVRQNPCFLKLIHGIIFARSINERFCFRLTRAVHLRSQDETPLHFF